MTKTERKKTMKINGKTVNGTEFANVEHKFYILENKKEREEAMKCGYAIYSIDVLEEKYKTAHHFKFIHNWSLTVDYALQFEKAIFEK